MAEHASAAVLGYGTQVLYGEVYGTGNSGEDNETFTPLHDVITADPPDEQADEVEVSHMESPNKTKEYIQGWIDAGSPTVELNWNPGIWADHQQILTDKAAGTKRNWRVILPPLDIGNDTPMETITFPAFVKGLKRGLDAKGAVKATVTLRADAVTSDVPTIS